MDFSAEEKQTLTSGFAQKDYVGLVPKEEEEISSLDHSKICVLLKNNSYIK